MLNKTEIKILNKLIDNLTKQYSIRELALELKLPYPQIHRNIKILADKKIIKIVKKGKSNIINIILENISEELIISEFERKQEIITKYQIINLLNKDLENIKYNQYICILFGSYANKTAKKDSDVDLLFVIPEEFDYNKFEKNIKNNLNIPNLDINITTEQGLIDMWNTPLKLNIGNELLTKHIVLKGAEQFLYLRKKYYVG